MLFKFFCFIIGAGLLVKLFLPDKYSDLWLYYVLPITFIFFFSVASRILYKQILLEIKTKTWVGYGNALAYTLGLLGTLGFVVFCFLLLFDF